MRRLTSINPLLDPSLARVGRRLVTCQRDGVAELSVNSLSLKKSKQTMGRQLDYWVDQ